MQALLDWLSIIDWGQFNFIKYILLAVITLIVFDGIVSFVFSSISLLFRGRK